MPREKMFALMIVPREQNPEETPFRVKLAVKNQVPHDDLPPDETPVSGGTTKSAAIRQADPNKPSAAGEDHFALVLTGEIDGKGKFRLQSDRIEFVPDSASKPAWPDKVTVNGKPWEHPEWTFLLDYVPDYSNGTVVRQSDGVTVDWSADGLEFNADCGGRMFLSSTRLILMPVITFGSDCMERS